MVRHYYKFKRRKSRLHISKQMWIVLIVIVFVIIMRLWVPTSKPQDPETIVTYQYIRPTPDITQKVVSIETYTVSSVISSIQPADYKQSPVSRKFPYTIDGTKLSITTTLYGGISNYLSKEDHSYYNDMETETIMELLENPLQDESMKPLIESIKDHSVNEQPKITISLVQHIPYNWNAYYSSFGSDWYYPYETLYANKGVCADKSLLLAYLLNELGYDTVLFEFSNHMAVGVKTTSNYDFYDTGYAFIETTRPTIITYVPTNYFGGFQVTSNPHIIHLDGGRKSLDVSDEYRDAVRMKQIESLGQVLDQSTYYEWSILTNRYDLQFET